MSSASASLHLRPRPRRSGAALLILLASVSVAGACGSDDAPQPAPQPVNDAAPDVADASTDPKPDAVKPKEDAAPTIRCTLDKGGDPVGLCVQKMVLQAWHEAAYVEGVGVYESWDPVTFLPDEEAGQPLRERLDNVAFGAAIGRYHASSGIYGDNELTPVLDAVLKSLVPIVTSEFASLPDSYDGQLYFDLRAMAGGLRLLNETGTALQLDAIADAYGRAIYDQHYRDVSLPGDAGADAAEGGFPGDPDGGSEGGLDADSDAASDAGSEAGSGGGSGGVIGQLSGEQASYEPASTSSAALVLLDLASRHATEDSEQASRWQHAAVRAMNHLWQRAREPSTGLLYRHMLHVSALHDEPSGQEPRDVMLSDVQATAALSMLRALELLKDNPGVLPIASSWPWLSRAEELIASMNAVPGLWDEELGGYRQGWVPSTAQLMTDKTTRGNGRMLSAVHRAAVLGSSPYAGQMTTLRALLMQRLPEHSSLLSASAGQQGFYLAVPGDYDMDGVQGAAPRYKSYFSRANGWGCEALDDGWFGIPH